MKDGRVVEERIIITDTVIDVRVPNQMEQIFDYKQVPSLGISGYVACRHIRIYTLILNGTFDDLP